MAFLNTLMKDLNIACHTYLHWQYNILLGILAGNAYLKFVLGFWVILAAQVSPWNPWITQNVKGESFPDMQKREVKRLRGWGSSGVMMPKGCTLAT